VPDSSESGGERPESEAVIAIDGPAGTGKSTVAARVADLLGMAHLDTGAMYRAVTVAVLKSGVDLDEPALVTEEALGADLALEGDRVWLGDDDVTAAIRQPEVDQSVSRVSAIPEVRADLVARQRAWVVAHAGGVLEGRDITTVVYPDAWRRVFLTARPEVRAQRRAGERDAADVERIAAELAERDKMDSQRADSPLREGAGVTVIDTSDLTIDAVVEAVIDGAAPLGTSAATRAGDVDRGQEGDG